MNQSKLSKEIGVSQGTISHWMNGKSKPTGIGAKILKDLYPEIYEKVMKKWKKQ